MGLATTDLTEGSSPLTRGKHQCQEGLERARGIIPAHAGKTNQIVSESVQLGDHPRSRGENTSVAAVAVTRPGSSPLTRGKPDMVESRSPVAGIIPAHAGKTRPWRPATRLTRDHPRSRGENVIWKSASSTSQGSSPLTRGKPDPWHVKEARGGIIPAHAGKTHSRLPITQPKWDHPRSRGENFCPRVTHLSSEGSSPLTRGKRHHGVDRGLDEGIIPAHAGKTLRGILKHGTRTDHPRSRGENASAPSSIRGRAGSSPLTRGKPEAEMAVLEGDRIIPAHAGKTTFDASRCSRIRDHPRSRGENYRRCPLINRQAGSSPLTRGKLSRPTPTVRAHGIIPAHAGKT